MVHFVPLVIAATLTLAAAGGAFAQTTPTADTAPSTGLPSAQANVAQRGMVVSQDSYATRVGVEILEKGGNAVDAAVAVGFALNNPQSQQPQEPPCAPAPLPSSAWA